MKLFETRFDRGGNTESACWARNLRRRRSARPQGKSSLILYVDVDKFGTRSEQNLGHSDPTTVAPLARFAMVRSKVGVQWLTSGDGVM